MADRHGFVQTVLDTAPQLVDHVIANSHLYPRSRQRAVLINAGLKARKRAAPASRQSLLPDPLTGAEIRVLEKLSERLTYTEIASGIVSVAQYRENTPAPRLYEARRHLPFVRDQARGLARYSVSWLLSVSGAADARRSTRANGARAGMPAAPGRQTNVAPACGCLFSWPGLSR